VPCVESGTVYDGGVYRLPRGSGRGNVQGATERMILNKYLLALPFGELSHVFARAMRVRANLEWIFAGSSFGV
jgi:hypothetical protein